MNIEEVAAENPTAIITEPIDINEGLDEGKAQRIAAAAGFYDQSLVQAVETMKKLYDLFLKHDATMLEINPMAEDRKGNGWFPSPTKYSQHQFSPGFNLQSGQLSISRSKGS